MGNGWKTTYVFQSCDVWNVAQHSRHSAAIFQKCFRNGDCFMLFHVVSVVPKFEDRPKGHAPRVPQSIAFWPQEHQMLRQEVAKQAVSRAICVQ